MAKKSLLSLATEGNPEIVEIDGREYKLTDFDSFNVVDQHGLQKLGQKLRDMSALPELTDSGVHELQNTVDELFATIAGEIPDDVRVRLRFGARLRLVNAYFLAFGAVNRAAVAPTTEENLPGGPVESSPNSSDSTEEQQPIG